MDLGGICGTGPDYLEPGAQSLEAIREALRVGERAVHVPDPRRWVLWFFLELIAV